MREYIRSCLYVYLCIVSLAPTVKGYVYSSCDFEDGLCGWKNLNWTRTEFKSPLENSGPQNAASGSYYIYSHQRETFNQTAILESMDIPGQSKYCLLFNYHMKGAHIERLEVTVSPSTESVWSREKEQGEDWICAAINITTSSPDSRIQIISHTGKTTSDLYDIIGLDNIKLLTPSGSFCNIQGCTASFDEISTTTVITSSTLLATDSSNGEIPTLEDSWLESNMPFLIGVPAAVLVISFVIVGACVFYTHHKRPKKQEPDSMDLMVMGPTRREREDRYREDPTSRDRNPAEPAYYTVVNDEHYDYLDVVQDTSNDVYLEVLSDTKNVNHVPAVSGVPNGGHPAELSIPTAPYYNDESPYIEPIETKSKLT
ncbi:uncharacterized protein LOC111133602 [Crassostrea virginica]